MIDNRIVNILSDCGVSIGTGFFVSSCGKLLTCLHVVEKAIVNNNRRIYFKFDSDDTIHHANVIATSDDVDVALLKADLDTSGFYALSVLCEENEKLKTYGFPNGTKTAFLADAVFQGYIRNKRLIQVCNANGITYGFSGAPLVAGDGSVVGMITSIPIDDVGRMNDIAHAIPSSKIIQSFPDSFKIVTRNTSAHICKIPPKTGNQLPDIIICGNKVGTMNVFKDTVFEKGITIEIGK